MATLIDTFTKNATLVGLTHFNEDTSTWSSLDRPHNWVKLGINDVWWNYNAEDECAEGVDPKEDWVKSTNWIKIFGTYQQKIHHGI